MNVQTTKAMHYATHFAPICGFGMWIWHTHLGIKHNYQQSTNTTPHEAAPILIHPPGVGHPGGWKGRLEGKKVKMALFCVVWAERLEIPRKLLAKKGINPLNHTKTRTRCAKAIHTRKMVGS